MADSREIKTKPLKKSRSGCKLIIKRVDNQITSYFPPSPLPDDDSVDSEDAELPVTNTVTDVEEKQKEENADDSTIPTPDSTPTKDKKDTINESLTRSPHRITLIEDVSSDDTDESKENRADNHTKSLHNYDGDSRLCESPKPTQAKQIKANPTPVKDSMVTRTRGRAGRGRQKKSGKQTTTASSNTQQTKKSSGKEAPKNPPAQSNHLLTDYFPIRRSSRKTSTDIKRQRQADLEKAIKEDCTDGLEVVEYPGKGRGVRANKIFHKGDFVVEYSGDLISVASAKDREKKYQANPDFGCYMYYFTHNNRSYCIDATAESGKLGRLLNHSCKTPNCSTKVVPIDNHPYLILVANREITVGEELIYDYGDRSKESLAAHPWLAL